MSSDAPVPLPRTAVPLGVTDPVEKARAELKAALAAIEEKANVPKRLATATDRGLTQARRFARRSPGATTAAVVDGVLTRGGAGGTLRRGPRTGHVRK